MKFCPVKQKLCVYSERKKGEGADCFRKVEPRNFHCFYGGVQREFKGLKECPKKG